MLFELSALFFLIASTSALSRTSSPPKLDPSNDNHLNGHSFEIPIEPSQNYFWSVFNFTNVCTFTECFYNFNISGPAIDADSFPIDAPPFDAYHCLGDSSPSVYTPCDIVEIDYEGNVEVREEHLDKMTAANFFVKLTFRKDNSLYRVEGNQTTPHTRPWPLNFSIFPRQVMRILDPIPNDPDQDDLDDLEVASMPV